MSFSGLMLGMMLAIAPVAAADEADVLNEGEVGRVVEGFRARVAEYHREIQTIIQQRKAERLAQIERHYTPRIDELKQAEIKAIDASIVDFEDFLRRYPDRDPYTPDVMFRLAELSFERAKREFDLVRAERISTYERQLNLFLEGKVIEEPKKPHPDFSRSMEYYRAIESRFPNYRYMDVVYYLMAYANQELEDYPGVRYAFDQLIARRPDSKYVPEARLRIGDAYFNEMKYDEALQSLVLARRYTDSPFYDQILYKLASTYFILNRYPESIEAFAELVEYSDAVKAETGRDSYFRPEAVKYIAFCYAQSGDYWTEGGIDNAIRYFERHDRPWKSEAFKELGEYYFLKAEFDSAIRAFQYIQKTDPWNPVGPELQKRIIDIHVMQKNEEQQRQELDRLVANYGEGSEWSERNKDNPKVVKEAERMAREALKDQAQFRHLLAQNFKRDGKTADALREYGRAADAYRDYLTKFPHDRDAYELNFWLADALYFSGQTDAAVLEYEKVRDSRLGTARQLDAAYMVVLGYGQQIVKSGDSKSEAAPDLAKKQGQGKLDIPPLKSKYIEAVDRYIALPKAEKDVVQLIWNSAEEYFGYNHMEDARTRYIDIVNRYPQSDVAVQAANRIVDTYTVEQDWAKVAEWSEKIAGMDIGTGDKKGTIKSEMQSKKGSAMLNVAKGLESQGKTEEAADEYLKVVRENPKHKDAPIALYNAAVLYYKAKRFDTAARTFERVVIEYPQSEFAAESLYQVAESAYNGFNLDKAGESYALLIAKYKLDDKKRCEVLYNHAQLKEFNLEYRDAARGYENYAVECLGKADDADRMLFRAGEVYEKMTDWKSMTAAYESFIERHGARKENKPFVIQAYYKIGDANWGQGQKAKAFEYYNRARNYFDANPELAKEPMANLYAAKAAFLFAEEEFSGYDKMKIEGSDKRFVQTMEAKEKKMVDLTRQFSEVKKYKSPEHFVASDYRVGYIMERFADSLFDAPVPEVTADMFRQVGAKTKDEKQMVRDEFEMQFKAQVAEQAKPYYKQAVELYQKALEDAKKARIFNTWTIEIMKALNRPNMQEFLTQEFKVKKNDKSRMRLEDTTIQRFDAGSGAAATEVK